MTDTYIDELLDELVPAFEPRSRDGWSDVLRRSRRASRRYAVLVAAALALVLVPTAVALKGKVTDLFGGKPAPPAISTSLQGENEVANLATKKGIGRTFPHVDVNRIRGVLEIRTADGPLDVWAAPNDAGGTCWFVDWANDAAPNGVQPGYGECDHGERARGISTSFGWDRRHPTLKTLFGHVDVRANRMVIELKDGSRHEIPAAQGVYLGSFDKDAQLEHIAAYDDQHQVATWNAPIR